MEIAIIGGGIVGLGLALNLHQRGLACRVYEAVLEVKELGVGITLLPHAMRELARLGLQEVLEPLGIENEESCCFNRFWPADLPRAARPLRRLCRSGTRHASRPLASGAVRKSA
jgi:2-polyprenyl-6-methoxyphenol hydroxylase-like FAD-dependent oxidoreductase